MDFLLERLARHGATPFIAGPEGERSYTDLIHEIGAWRARLAEQGIAPGQGVALAADYAADSIALLLALLLNRNVAVPLGSQTGETRQKLLTEARVVGCFNRSAAGAWDYEPLPPTEDHPLLAQLRALGEPGAIIFTSGSSGTPKAALLRPARLAESFLHKKPNTHRTLTFLKMDHIGGLNTLFSILMGGGTIVTSAARNPDDICQTIERQRVELLPTTPTFLNMLILSGARQRYDLSSLKLITYGTEPMPVSTLKAVARTFPGVALKQTYGLTELGIMATQSKDTESTWMKVGGEGVETRVVDGVLWIRAATAMLGYLNAPSPFDAEGWYNTGDSVEVDGEYMRVLGRKQELINVGGEKVHPAEVENVLLEVPNITGAVVQGKRNPVTGQIVVATVTLEHEESKDALEKRIYAHCATRLEKYKIPSLIFVSTKTLMGERFKQVRSA